MHDLLNNILSIISLVVHTIVRPIIERRGNHDIAGHDNERSNHSKQIERKDGSSNEEINASK